MSFGDPFLFGESDDRLPLRLDAVIRRWWGMLAHETPWSAMHADDAFGMMSKLLKELLNESLEVNRSAQDRRIAIAAHQHGIFRRSQLCGLANLMWEFDVMLAALVDEVRGSRLGGLSLGDAMVSLTAELGVARKAAMTGWRRESLRGGADATR